MISENSVYNRAFVKQYGRNDNCTIVEYCRHFVPFVSHQRARLPFSDLLSSDTRSAYSAR